MIPMTLLPCAFGYVLMNVAIVKGRETLLTLGNGDKNSQNVLISCYNHFQYSLLMFAELLNSQRDYY